MLLALPCASRAQGRVEVDLPPQDPFPAAPEIVLRAIGYDASTAPRSLRLRLSLDAGFGLIVFDSTVAGDQARFTLTRLLPEFRDIFVEATAFDSQNRALTTVSQLAGHTGPRLRLLSPEGTSVVNLPSRHPTFSWRSAFVTTPPGPWTYELYITNRATLVTTSYLGITDSTFTIPDSLEANASYRWRVVARVVHGIAADSAAAVSKATFIITPADAPLATLLYQNFPNPFPSAFSQTTCFWFDLKIAAKVELTILNLRGQLVRRMIPGPAFASRLPSGRYGRLREIDGDGCDPTLAWDGTADDGRTVPPGVYLLRFKTDNAAESVKKIVFVGH